MMNHDYEVFACEDDEVRDNIYRALQRGLQFSGDDLVNPWMLDLEPGDLKRAVGFSRYSMNNFHLPPGIVYTETDLSQYIKAPIRVYRVQDVSGSVVSWEPEIGDARALLVIERDDSIRVGQEIEVIFHNPMTRDLHYSSGRYEVKKVSTKVFHGISWKNSYHQEWTATEITLDSKYDEPMKPMLRLVEGDPSNLRG